MSGYIALLALDVSVSIRPFIVSWTSKRFFHTVNCPTLLLVSFSKSWFLILSREAHSWSASWMFLVTACSLDWISVEYIWDASSVEDFTLDGGVNAGWGNGMYGLVTFSVNPGIGKTAPFAFFGVSCAPRPLLSNDCDRGMLSMKISLLEKEFVNLFLAGDELRNAKSKLGGFVVLGFQKWNPDELLTFVSWEMLCDRVIYQVNDY